jgi:PAS domain S-box-containing protein
MGEPVADGASLKYRLDLEEVITEILTGFIGRSAEEVDPEIERALGDIARFTGTDRAYIFLFREGQTLMDCTHEWCSPGVEPRAPALQALTVAEYPNVVEGILRGRAVHMPDVSAYPSPAGPEKDEVLARGVRSILLVPMICGGAVLGFLGLDSLRDPAPWEKEVIGLVRRAGEAFANSLKRKRRDEEQWVAYKRLLSVIEFFPDPTFIIDREKRVIAWNQAIEAMTGVRRAEIVGQGDYAYAVPFFGERRPILVDLLDLSTAELEATYKYVTRAGANVYAESFIPALNGGRGAHLWGVAAPLFDEAGNRWGAIECIRDVTDRIRMEKELRTLNAELEERVQERTKALEREFVERRLAEESLRLSEQKYRELVQSANSIILKLDTAGRVTFINEFAQGFFGYGEEEILGRSVVGTIVPEVETGGRDLGRFIEDLGRHPERYARNENENVKKGGERVWISWTNKPIFGPAGELAGVLCVGNDITELILLERQLVRAKEAAESADRLKSAFLATMSHELRTPLNAIIGFTGILLQGLPGPLNEEQQKQMGMVRHSARRLLELITDVLDISKIEAGRLEVARAPFDLRQSVLKAVQTVRPAAEGKGLYLRADVRPGVGTTTGDARRVEQVLLNLLNNAVKFTQAGGITLEADRKGDRVVIAVRDTGIGVRSEELQKIFEPFYQCDGGLTRKHEGTGLGLSISRKLAQKMGGSVTAESRSGEGSTFTLVLPAPAGGEG